MEVGREQRGNEARQVFGVLGRKVAPSELPSRALASSNWRSPAAGNARPPQNDDRPDRPARRFDARGRQNSSYSGDQQLSQRSANNKKPVSDEAATTAIAEGRRIYVGNLPYMVKEEDVSKLFLDEGYDVERIVISIDPFTGRNPSYCFVELQNKEQADRAMQSLSGKDFFRRPLKVNSCIPKSRAPDPESFNRWERKDADEHWTGLCTAGRRLYVRGLPRPVTQEEAQKVVANLFKDFKIDAISKVNRPCDTYREANPKWQYYAFVDMPSEAESDAAILALNGTNKFGGFLTVTKAKKDLVRKVTERYRYYVDKNRGENRDEQVRDERNGRIQVATEEEIAEQLR